MIKKILLNNQEHVLELTELSNDHVTINCEGQLYTFKIYSRNDKELILKDESGKLYTFTFSKDSIHYLAKEYQIKKISHYNQDDDFGPSQNTLASPLPGRVISIEVSEGETIMKGETIAVIEAMKMEHRIIANTSGRILKLYTRVGESISEGFIIGEIDEQRD
ncbi:MAG: acetyl-CoA carboxylase biotin carboxyl carrier protein subunit [Lentisphaerales bacterium]|nr:acetyl-CoA carboxylase biotin carboxyl carrier protein subunit [Lentisphaerales bacterium]